MTIAVKARSASTFRRDPMHPSTTPPIVKPPLISIGLPVYNGANFLADTLDSILAQSFQDFELIIADNGSTDETPQIIRRYAAQDKRIRVLWSNLNRGATWNFNRVVAKALGGYFKWAAHDDLLADTYLEACVAGFEDNPDAVVVQTGVRLIDENAGEIFDYNDGNAAAKASTDATMRFAELIKLNHACFDVFGLIRTDVLRKTHLIESYSDSDRALLAELALFGRIHTIPEPLFLPREHAERSTRKLAAHERAGWFDTRQKGRTTAPRWQLYQQYRLILRQSQLTANQKRACRWLLLAWLPRHSKSLAKDFLVASYDKVIRIDRAQSAGQAAVS